MWLYLGWEVQGQSKRLYRFGFYLYMWLYLGREVQGRSMAQRLFRVGSLRRHSGRTQFLPFLPALDPRRQARYEEEFIRSPINPLSMSRSMVVLSASSHFYKSSCPLVSLSVGNAIVWNAQNGWFWRISSSLSPFMPYHIHFHSFTHSSKTFVHKFLTKRGALIGLNLALFLPMAIICYFWMWRVGADTKNWFRFKLEAKTLLS